MRPLAVAAVALALTIPLGACREPPAMTPEDGYLYLYRACDKHDGARLFDALDTPTQWSIESVQRAQREMKKIILADYPAAERDRALARIPAAADEIEENARLYFKRLPTTPAALDAIKKRLDTGSGRPIGAVDDATGTATLWRNGGSVFKFAKDKEGRWGFAELQGEWDNAKLRATHDLETVRQNAVVYRQARGTGGGAK